MVAGQLLPATAVSSSEGAVAEALDRIRRYATQGIVLQVPSASGAEQAKHKLASSAMGAEIDRAHLVAFMTDALDPQSALRRAYEERRSKDSQAVLHVPIPIRVDPARSASLLLTIKDESDRQAVDATVDMSTRTVRPERIGLRMDIYATLGRLQDTIAAAGTEMQAVVEQIEPRIRADALANVRLDAVLGFFETRYSRSAKSRARTYNLRLAASRLDGAVVLPGETFDFNSIVGPRDEANGYRVAPVIAEGELVDGIGGGTCQVSGTLHGAAFFSGLEIVERRPHSRPSSYIKLGMDAAVAYPSINFRVRNPFDVPVVLHETVKGGVVRAEVLGPKRKHTVSFFRRVDAVIPFEVVERETDSLPEGKRILSQRGVPGFKVTVFRIVRKGAYAVRTKVRDHYPPTMQIIKVGTGPEDKKSRLRDDRHREYTADEYLVMTQGPKIGLRRGQAGMVESRVPGKTGRRGWQKEEGMPVYEPDEEDEDEAEDAGEGLKKGAKATDGPSAKKRSDRGGATKPGKPSEP